MANNLDVYKQVADVPKNAQKSIQAGRLKGMTDINPMWRIEKLTEIFGMCGFGWYYDIIEEKTQEVSNGEILAFVKINLYVKIDNEWSKPITGLGGNKMTTKESKGLHNSDECFKMALTDALSVACKSLGFGANIYWQAGRSKYTEEHQQQKQQLSDAQIKRLYAIASSNNISNEDVHKFIKKKYNLDSTKDLTKEQYDFTVKRMEKPAENK